MEEKALNYLFIFPLKLKLGTLVQRKPVVDHEFSPAGAGQFYSLRTAQIFTSTHISTASIHNVICISDHAGPSSCTFCLL